jgi:hypothetical protein
MGISEQMRVFNEEEENRLGGTWEGILTVVREEERKGGAKRYKLTIESLLTVSVRVEIKRVVAVRVIRGK